MSALYRETGGSGPPLVLLHGWGMNLRVFDPLRAALAAHYTVTALDLPGHGRSAWPQGLDAAQQLELLAAQVPRGATLVGWSLGGQLAMQLAARPELEVRRLVLLATTPRFVRGADWPHGLAAATVLGFAAQLERDVDATIAAFLELQVRGSASSGQVLASLTRALRDQGSAQPAALAFGLRLLQDHDLRLLARQLAVPTLVIAGEYDRITPPQAGAALAQLLPQAVIEVIARAGHAPFLSHPAAVLAACDPQPATRAAAAAP